MKATPITELIQLVHRQQDAREIKVLEQLLKKLHATLKHRIRPHHYLIALAIAILFTYFAAISRSGITGLPSGFIAVFAWAFMVFAPYETYKLRKQNGRIVERVKALLQSGSVETIPITAIRIAQAKEFEDEGDLFIVEYEPDRLLFLWDHDRFLQRSFPCLSFELYTGEFLKLTGRMICPRSEKITAVQIEPARKWKQMDHPGIPEHFQTMEAGFDAYISSIGAE
jgi:hypothetical protein